MKHGVQKNDNKRALKFKTALKKSRPKILMILSVLAVFAILGTSGFFGMQAYIKNVAGEYIVTLETAPSVDAVLVPGAKVSSSGQVSYVLEDRLLYALRLYEAGRAGVIIVSGDHGREEYDEVNAMRSYLIERGVPKEKIFMDHAGFNTYDSMYRAKLIFRVNSMIISTQNFHIDRSVYIARKLGIDAYGYPSADKDLYNMKFLNARESLAKIKAFADVEILRRKPKYGGPEIPFWTSGELTEG